MTPTAPSSALIQSIHDALDAATNWRQTVDEEANAPGPDFDPEALPAFKAVLTHLANGHMLDVNDLFRRKPDMRLLETLTFESDFITKKSDFKRYQSEQYDLMAYALVGALVEHGFFFEASDLQGDNLANLDVGKDLSYWAIRVRERQLEQALPQAPESPKNKPRF